jgi:hypothetical protein
MVTSQCKRSRLFYFVYAATFSSEEFIEFRVQSSEFRVQQSSEFRVQSSEFSRVQRRVQRVPPPLSILSIIHLYYPSTVLFG